MTESMRQKLNTREVDDNVPSHVYVHYDRIHHPSFIFIFSEGLVLSIKAQPSELGPVWTLDKQLNLQFIAKALIMISAYA